MRKAKGPVETGPDIAQDDHILMKQIQTILQEQR